MIGMIERLILFLLLAFPAFGQWKSDPKKLDAWLQDGKTKEALAWAQQALKMNPGDPDLLHTLGKIHKQTRNFKVAEVFLAQAIERSQAPSDQLYFDMAENEQMANQLSDAIEFYELISPKFPQMATVKKRIAQCRFGKELMEKPVEVKISNLGKGVNSSAHEFHPLVSSDEVQLIFSQSESFEFQPFSPNKSRILQSFLKLGWEKAVLMPPPVKSHMGEIGVHISPDANQITLLKSGKDTDFFSSEFKDSRWSTPKSLPFNSPKSETSLCYSADGKKVFFVSNRNGNKDIFMATRNEKGIWSKPLPMGSRVNTKEDEESPWLDSEGKNLYFSSKGHPGMGGFDIFKVALDQPNEPVQNLGFPINSTSDDLFFMLMPDGKSGYYSSLRSGGFGGSDIYQVRFGVSNNRQMALFKGTISDFAGQPVDALVAITEMESKKVISKTKAHPETGTFVNLLPKGKSYSILVEKEGYLFYSDFINLEEENSPTDQVRDIRMQKLQPGVILVLNNIFFDPGKSSLKKESSQELQRILMILRQNPGMVAEISAHLEPGSPEDDGSLKLSENRAQAIMDYLVATGIKSTRLVAKGYGSTKPPTDASQIPTRRCELKIISN